MQITKEDVANVLSERLDYISRDSAKSHNEEITVINKALDYYRPVHITVNIEECYERFLNTYMKTGKTE